MGMGEGTRRQNLVVLPNSDAWSGPGVDGQVPPGTHRQSGKGAAYGESPEVIAKRAGAGNCRILGTEWPERNVASTETELPILFQTRGVAISSVRWENSMFRRGSGMPQQPRANQLASPMRRDRLGSTQSAPKRPEIRSSRYQHPSPSASTAKTLSVSMKG